MKIHLDTDLGGDIDDLCALAMLLRWPDVEITGVTTVSEEGGRRAGYVRRALALEGRREIPVAAGADAPNTLHYYDDQTYWGERVAPAPNPLADALALLSRSIERGATVVGIGPYTNLSLLEQQHSGILSRARLFLMGGSVSLPPRGFPQWDFEMDYNIQSDVAAARFVFEHSRPTLVPLSVTVQTALRRAHLEHLRGAGALGRLIARQAEAFALDEQMEEKFGRTCEGLPPDIINFQHDALACAVAAGWSEGVELSSLPLRMESRGGLLHQMIDDARPLSVVTRIDGDRFSQFWIDTLTRQAQT